MNIQRLARSVFAVALSMMLLTGCDGILDLDPQQSIDEELALASPQGVETALVGAYDVLGNVNLYGGRTMLLPDLLGDDGDVNWTGTFSQPREIYNKAILISNTFVATQWIQAYNAINIANNVLSALDVFENQQDRARVEGEARFIRGLMYFQLVRLYGRAWDDGDPATNLAVPIVTSPTRDVTAEDQRPRDTVADVYALVFDDLRAARNLLPEDNGFFADTYVASAILSRVHLERREWEFAATEASRVINSGRYQLADSYEAVFNRVDDIPEYVFATQITTQDGFHGMNEFYGAEPIGRGDIDISQQHLDRYEEGDERADLFFVDGIGAVRTGKWRFGHGQGVNIPIVRLAEMYLTRAEGNFRAGSEVGGAAPADDVNVIRERAGLDPLESVTLDQILHERRLELAFEGHQLFDLRRARASAGNIPWDSPRLVYPVPEREMDANPALVQNPGYGS